jgi:hypothetical protein
MNPRLTPEQSAALRENGDQLEIVDPTTNRTYIVIDPSILRRAQALLKQKEEQDRRDRTWC